MIAITNYTSKDIYGLFLNPTAKSTKWT